MLRVVENMTHSMFNHEEFYGFVKEFMRNVEFV